MEINNKQKKEIKLNKKLIVFDLDGTLTKSKSNLDTKMSKLIYELLRNRKVAVIGGGSYNQFKKQFLSKLKYAKNLSKKNLFIFPTSGSTFYRYENYRWKKVYQLTLSKEKVKKIAKSFKETFAELKYKNPKKTYGKIIENRKTQITFSALGQKAPLKDKIKWNSLNNKTRLKMRDILEKKLPELEVRIGGLTSIDVTEKGIDKGYGIRQIMKNLKVSKKDILFIGDAIYKGGNDYPAKLEGISTIKVSGPKDTEKLINILINKVV